ncbi:MAG: radical SAM protein [Candidatus Omnitrophica bacterium]|nr:radical SAM protein [Candidatus Omnitrophota bacterium]
MPVPYKVGKDEKNKFLQNVEAQLHHFPFPPQIVVESTAACNLECIHCGHATMKRMRGNMKEELWKKIIDEIADTAPATEVWPTFYGEALLLGKKVTERIRYAANKGLTNLVLNTNGTMLSDELIREVLDCGLVRLIISLDGFKKETFEKIRKKANHEKVFRQTERLLEIKRNMKASHTRIEVQFSKMDENESEVDAFREYWLARGAYVKTREKLTWAGTKSASNLYQEMDRIACPWALRTCAIHWNGDLVACAVDYEGGFVAGNVMKDSIATIWNTKHKEFATLHLSHQFDKLPSLCRNCPDWQVGGGAALEKPEVSSSLDVENSAIL